MGVYEYIGVWGHEKQAHTDVHTSNKHDFPATMDGKFPKIHVWSRGNTEGNGRSGMVTGWFVTMQWGMGNDTIHIKRQVGALRDLWG